MTASPGQAGGGEARVPLKRLVGYGLVGQLTFVASQFVLLMALSRFGTVADVGRYGLASAIATPIFMMFAFGFRTNQATDLDNRHSFREFVVLRKLSSALSYAIIAVIAAAFVDRETALVLLAFGASRATDNHALLLYGLFQKYDRMDLVARSLVLRGVGGAAVFALAMVVTREPLAAYLALFAAWLLVALVLDQPAANRMVRGTPEDRPATRKGLVDILRTSWPMAANALLGGAQASTPRLAINGLLGIEALGHFTLVAYAMQATNTVVTAIAQSMLARLALYRKTGKTRTFWRTLNLTLAGLAGAAVVGVLIALAIGGPLLRLVFGDDYAGLGGLLALCIASAMMSAAVTMLQAGMSSTRRFLTTMWTRIVGVAVVAAASFAGAIYFGLYGVVAAMALSFVVQFAILIVLLRGDDRAVPAEGEAA